MDSDIDLGTEGDFPFLCELNCVLCHVDLEIRFHIFNETWFLYLRDSKVWDFSKLKSK